MSIFLIRDQLQSHLQLEISSYFSNQIHPLYFSEKSPLVNGKKIVTLGSGETWYVASKTSLTPATFISSTLRSISIESFVSNNNLYMAVRECTPTCSEKILKTDGSSSSIVSNSDTSLINSYIYIMFKAGDDIFYTIRDYNAGLNTLMKILPNGTAQSVVAVGDVLTDIDQLFYFNNQLFISSVNNDIRYINNGNLENFAANIYVGVFNSKIISISGTSLKQTNQSLVESSFSDLSAFGPIDACEIKNSNIYCSAYNGSSPIQGMNQYNLVKISSSGVSTLLASNFVYGGSNVGILEKFWLTGNSMLYFAENGNGNLTVRKVNITTLENSEIEPQFETQTEVAIIKKAGSYVFHDNYSATGGGLIVAPDLTFTYTPKVLWFNRDWWIGDQ